MQHHTAEGQQRIGERMLSKQTGIGYIGEDANGPRHADTDAHRFVHAPVQQQHGDEIGTQHQRHALPGQAIEQHRDHDAAEDEEIADGALYLGLVGIVQGHYFFRFALASSMLISVGGRSGNLACAERISRCLCLSTPPKGRQVMRAKG